MSSDDHPFDLKIDEDGNIPMIDEETGDYVSCDEWVIRKIRRDLAKILDREAQDERLKLIDRLREEAKEEEPEYGTVLWKQLATSVPEYNLANHFIENHKEVFAAAGIDEVDDFQIKFNDDNTVTINVSFRVPPSTEITVALPEEFGNV